MKEGLHGSVAEVQGVYGAFTFPELLLQQVWQRGEFQRTGLRTVEGRSLEVLHVGQWNRLGGPDFRTARLRWAEGEQIGDVELHLQAEDWTAHGHDRDPAYAGVVLHAVLFPPPAGWVTRRADGREVPMLVLLPLLWHGLEEYAEEAAVERLAQRSLRQTLEGLEHASPEEIRAILQQQAGARWRGKVHYARLRLERLGWEGACHHTAMEVLGYRFNRAPMLGVAGRWPLADWAAGRVDVATAWLAEAEHWSVQGVRPANLPRPRLLQYAAWARAVPDWPARWQALAPQMPVDIKITEATARVRRAHHLVDWRKRLAGEVGGEVVRGARFDNLIGDGLLPLAAAAGVADGFGIWFHWFVGDGPPRVREVLQTLGVFTAPRFPAGHGLSQGLLGWWLDRERREIPGSGRRA